MVNNLQQEPNAPTTHYNPRAASVGNYANKHTSPSGPAVSNASNSSGKPKRGRGRALCHYRHFLERHVAVNPPRVCLRKHWMGLQPNSGSKANCLLILILFIPFSAGISLNNLVVDGADIQGSYETQGVLEGFSITATNQPIEFTISGQATIETEFIDRYRVDQTAISSEPGTTTTTASLSSTKFIVQEFGELLLYNIGGDVIAQGHSTSLSHERSNVVWSKSFDSARSVPKIQAAMSIREDPELLTRVGLDGPFSFSFWDGSFTANNTEYWAGERNQIETLGRGAGESRGQIIHVSIENGTISTGVLQASAKLYWNQVSVIGTGELMLQKAESLSGKELGDIESHGPWSFTANGGETVQVSKFQAEEVTLDGTIIQNQESVAWLGG
jgi:hypothetical protein